MTRQAIQEPTFLILMALAAGLQHGYGINDHPPASLQVIVVAREPTVLAAYPQHPLAARRSARMSAMRDEPVVTLTRECRLRTVLETECRRAGSETSDLNVMVELVAEGIGVALMPRSGREKAGDVAPRARTPQPERREDGRRAAGIKPAASHRSPSPAAWRTETRSPRPRHVANYSCSAD